MRTSLLDLICFGVLCLLGPEGEDWAYYETDWAWWTLRLYTRRN